MATGGVTVSPDFDVVVVGAGASGTLVAIHLLKEAPHLLRICLLERGGRLGEGVAYSTHQEAHVLNVTASRMSALPQDELHFLRWMQQVEPFTGPGDFVPRYRYAQYLRATVAEVGRNSPARLVVKKGEALDILHSSSGAGFDVHLAGGEVLSTRAVVLALGNMSPPDLLVPHGGLYQSPRYLKSLWAADDPSLAPHSQGVLLLGTGLTMVDAVLSFHAFRHQGPIHALSRHGSLPFPHSDQEEEAFRLPEAWAPRSLREIVRGLRAHAEQSGWPNAWRAAVDALRPRTQALWAGLPLEDRWRFLRHVRAFWDVRRHRVAPHVGRTLRSLQATGQLQIHAGRVLDFRLEGDAVQTRFRPRGSPNDLCCLESSVVINCVGPLASVQRSSSVLLQNLLKRRLARPDSVDMGLDVDANGRLVGAGGAPTGPLFALGPLLRGTLWEIVAIPEISQQARALAGLLIGEHRGSSATSAPPTL